MVGVHWQGKLRHIARLSVLITVPGSVHSMPAQAKLHVLGHYWCKAQLISHTAQHGIRQLPRKDKEKTTPYMPEGAGVA